MAGMFASTTQKTLPTSVAGGNLTTYSPSQGQSGGGMFGNFGDVSSFTPSYNTSQFGQRSYDTSGIAAGVNQLNNTNYNPTQYNGYQFSNPNQQKVGQFGVTNPNQVSSVYNQAMNNATRPIMAQSEERMRQMGQGFQGGRPNGAAGQEMMLKNAQQTGKDIQNTSSNIGAQMSNQMLTEGETARAHDYQTQVDKQNQMFGAEQDRQKQQAQQDYLTAGFTNDQAKYATESSMAKAKEMLGTGFQLPQFQMQMNQAGMAPYMQMFNSLQDKATQQGVNTW